MAHKLSEVEREQRQKQRDRDLWEPLDYFFTHYVRRHDGNRGSATVDELYSAYRNFFSNWNAVHKRLCGKVRFGKFVRSYFDIRPTNSHRSRKHVMIWPGLAI